MIKDLFMGTKILNNSSIKEFLMDNYRFIQRKTILNPLNH